MERVIDGKQVLSAWLIVGTAFRASISTPPYSRRRRLAAVPNVIEAQRRL